MTKLNIAIKSFLQIVKEFIKALGQARTYAIHKNGYCFFGILWGLPVPLVTVGIDVYSSGLALSRSNIINIILSHPFHFFFILHPVLFGIVFGAMGTVRYNKEQKIKEFEKSLINKNIELESTNKKLKELDKLKSDFLSIVSHELRTPLTTIQGYITFLLDEKTSALNQTQRECLKISEDEADRLNRLIEELLDLAKIDSGQFKVNLSSVDMRGVINKALSSLQFSAKDSGVGLENGLPDALPPALADKERVSQVVTNLIENAIKFNRRGGKVSITASHDDKNGKLIFCVLDTGIGIPEDKISHIFDKFYQVDSSTTRMYGGCGLGLAISESILKLHHGRIWVKSEIGRGSKFFFELLTFEPHKA